MELSDLNEFFKNSPTIALLRSPMAPFVLDFFDRAFKRSDEIAIDHERLLTELIDYQEMVRESYLGTMEQDATFYLNDWCGKEKRYLQRFYQEGEQPHYQLMPATETALRFVQETLDRQAQVAGTESRIRTIIDKLREISTYASDDTDKRIETLQAERDRLQREIDTIIQTGEAAPRHDARIREDFHFAIELLRRVLSDFRQVEEDFRSITQSVQSQHHGGELNKGGLLGFVLDEEDALRESDAGVSFYEFRNQFFNPQHQDYVRELIDEVRRIAALGANEQGKEALRQMMPALTAQANQVMRTVQRLSGTIRRFLDTQVAAERRKLTELIGEIQALVVANADQPPGEEFSIEVEIKPEFQTPMSREMWSEPPTINRLSVSDATGSTELADAEFDLFVQMRRLDWSDMRSKIRHLTQRDEAASLPRLLQENPPKSGAVEVLAYVQIAQDDGHIVKPDEQEEVELPPGELFHGKRILTIPRVIFRKTETL
tara:strand:+ start:938 stop:2404 length:1467 start_codon:yes stop_codon:yes gene_type:complete